jgi:2-oxoglutarate ferredoxin oxidoreductase subunit gamma
MQNDVIVAGFGGQGVLLIGKMLAYAGMADGKEVSWLPSYGPEMRGGTCNCTVVISDKPVGSPVVERPRAAMVLNLPSLDKFEATVKPGGLLLINSSLINRGSSRTDLHVILVPANEIANELGNPRGANMVALGAFLGATHAVSLEAVDTLIRDTFAGKPKVIEVNLTALRRGYEIGERALAGSGAAPAAQEVRA